MRATTKYLFWLVAILFGFLPVLLTVASTPDEMPKLFVFSNYPARDMTLFGITVEVVALIDSLEVITSTKTGTYWNRTAYILSLLIFSCSLLKISGYSFWVANLKVHKVADDACWLVICMVFASFLCALGGRTAYIIAEA